MATVEQNLNRARSYFERLWQGTNSAAQPDNDSSADIPEPLVNRKDPSMYKMGNREEKDVSNPAGHGPEGAHARTGASKETVIGENITIEGTVHAKEDILMEGRIKGTIESKSHRITIGPKGHIEADVEAEEVVISGRMTGNILAHNKVQITRDADFTGSIKAKHIAIEDGAYIKATIELEKQERQATKASDVIVFEGTPVAQKPAKGEPQSTKPV